MAVEVRKLLTPADVEAMVHSGELGPNDIYEVVNGEIVWMAPAHDPQPAIYAEIIGALHAFARSIGARIEDSSAGFWVGADRQQLRGPDVSLIAKDRLDIVRTDRFNQGAPDLAVEVLSEGQFGENYVRTKVPEYFAAGAKVVWFVDHRNRSVRVYEPGKHEVTIYSADAEITLDQIAPGFRCRVSEFFPN
jgi:Uma2 family endonuclease